MYKIIDFAECVRKKNQIIVSMPFDEIPAKYITRVDLVPHKGDPAVLIQAKGKEYIYVITNGARIYMMNSILRTLNLDIKIEFKTYKQYGYMLMEISDLLYQRNSKNNIVSL